MWFEVFLVCLVVGALGCGNTIGNFNNFPLFSGVRQRVLVEEPEHVVLGRWIHLGHDNRRGRETVPRPGHQRYGGLILDF